MTTDNNIVATTSTSHNNTIQHNNPIDTIQYYQYQFTLTVQQHIQQYKLQHTTHTQLQAEIYILYNILSINNKQYCILLLKQYSIEYDNSTIQHYTSNKQQHTIPSHYIEQINNLITNYNLSIIESIRTVLIQNELHLLKQQYNYNIIQSLQILTKRVIHGYNDNDTITDNNKQQHITQPQYTTSSNKPVINTTLRRNSNTSHTSTIDSNISTQHNMLLDNDNKEIQDKKRNASNKINNNRKSPRNANKRKNSKNNVMDDNNNNNVIYDDNDSINTNNTIATTNTTINNNITATRSSTKKKQRN